MFLLFSSEAGAEAPRSAPLRGQVVDTALGQPIVGITVRIEGTKLAVLTDEAGRFSFESPPLGRLVIVAEDVVIEPTRSEVGAERSEPLVIRADYASRPQYTVTIVAPARRAMTASTSRVTAREMAAVPRRNAEDALRLVPGITLVQHGSEGKGHQFFVRGFDAVHGTDLELTVEGIRVNEWSNIHAQGYIDLGFVIPETIDAVEVVKGPFTLEQGAFAMAGSASYRLGIAEEDRGVRAAYVAGTTNRHRGLVSYSPRNGDGRDFIATEALHDDGFGQNREIDRSAVLGRVRLLDSPTQGTLSVLGAGYVARFSLPGTVREEDVREGRIGFHDSYDDAGRGLSSRGLAALAYERRSGDHDVRLTIFGEYRRLELLENFTGFLIDPINGDRRSQSQNAWSFGATGVYELRLGERLILQTGLGVRGDRLDQTQAHVDQQEVELELERSLDGVQTLSHAHAGVQWRPVDPLQVSGGVRLDLAQLKVRDRLSDGFRESTDALVAISPRLTAEWQFSEPLRVFAAYGRGFRPPEARSFTAFALDRAGISEEVYDGGEPAMTVADAFELGTRYNPSRYFGARLSGFVTMIERESVFDHVSGINLELNSTQRVGAELELRSNPLGWLMLSADATYVDARFVESGNPVPLAPWLTGGFRAVITHERGLYAGLRFIGLAPRSLPHGAEGAPLAMLDATAGYRWNSLRLDLEIENILDLQIREGEYHYASHWRPGEEPSAIPVVHYAAGPPLNARLGVSVVF